MTAVSVRRTLFTMLCGAMAAFLVFSLAGVRDAGASHEPANKAAAAGSDLDEINGTDPILSETFKVSSQEDMIIQVTSECSILTSLITGDDEMVPDGESFSQDFARAFGQVELYVTLDGRRVPVAVDDPAGPDAPGNDDPEEGQDDTQEEGEVVFCNRAYQRTVQDTDGGDDEGTAGDSIDTERDYIRTRTANAFNWLGVDIGFDYDDSCPAGTTDPSCEYSVSNGNNIIEAVLWAEYEATGVPDDPDTPENEASSTCPTAPGTEITCSEAFVGSRTMILEPIKLSIHEQVERDDLDGGS